MAYANLAGILRTTGSEDGYRRAKVKSAEYMMLLSPIGKTILIGKLSPKLRAALVAYIDALARMWAESISEERLAQLITDTDEVCTKLRKHTHLSQCKPSKRCFMFPVYIHV